MDKTIKETVKEKYAEIATQQSSSCCGSSGCCGQQAIEITMIGDEYNSISGHIAEADLGLGCGVPTEFAKMKTGDTVLDLGSGAGNDVFIAAAIVGDTGRVIGVDMTPEMIEKAEKNKTKFGFTNTEFRLGEIEALPVKDNSIDVVISNCVLNLVPDKQKAFAEIYRTLKPGGHFCISDVVLEGDIPDGFKKSAEMYAGCVAGAVKKEEYLSIIADAKFKDIDVVKTNKYEVPDELYQKYLTPEEIEVIRKNNFGIFSVTVVANK